MGTGFHDSFVSCTRKVTNPSGAGSKSATSSAMHLHADIVADTLDILVLLIPELEKKAVPAINIVVKGMGRQSSNCLGPKPAPTPLPTTQLYIIVSARIPMASQDPMASPVPRLLNT